MAAGARTAVKVDQLRSARIAPDVVSELAPSLLDFRVAYAEVEVANGLAMRKAQTQQRPHVELRGEPFSPSDLYTLMMGPAPPLGTHRYVFVLFKQKGTLDVNKIEGREKFDVNGFAVNFEPRYPVGAVYYLVEHDDALKHPGKQV